MIVQTSFCPIWSENMKTGFLASWKNYSQVIFFCSDPENADIIAELTMLLGKIEEMKTQRVSLEEQLRKDIQEDDITNALVTREGVNREVGKIEEMKSQRVSLKEQLRKDTHEDDITNVLVTSEGVNRKVGKIEEMKSQRVSLKEQLSEKRYT